jgi:hypothetical protein
MRDWWQSQISFEVIPLAIEKIELHTTHFTTVVVSYNFTSCINRKPTLNEVTLSLFRKLASWQGRQDVTYV